MPSKLFLKSGELRSISGYSNYGSSKAGIIFNLSVGRRVVTEVVEGGFVIVRLKNDSGKWRRLFVHEFVAKGWIENKHGYKKMWHKNRNRSDNRPSNLMYIPGEEIQMPDSKKAERISDSRKKLPNKYIYYTNMGTFNTLKMAALAAGISIMGVKKRIKTGYLGYRKERNWEAV